MTTTSHGGEDGWRFTYALMAGFVAQHPIGHIGDTADIADIVHYLVGPRAKFITGSAFVVDGGLTL